MSHADYQASQEAARGLTLIALIMAAMQTGRRPDQEKLRAVYPDIWAELLERERAFGGLLANERVISEPASEHSRLDLCAASPTNTEGEQQ